jgi:hypothetical protein
MATIRDRRKAPWMTSIKGRPTVYNGIQMRSRLEADYAAYLDGNGRTWKYEPECFANAEGQWLPDFQVIWPKGGETFVELKPAGRLEDNYMGLNDESIDKHLTRMAIAWASKPDAELALIYWNYGGRGAMEIFSSGHNSPWLAKGGPLPLLWTGMGQYNLCDRDRG